MFAIMQQMLFVPTDLVGFNGLQKALCLSRSLVFIFHVIAVYIFFSYLLYLHFEGWMRWRSIDFFLVQKYFGLTDQQER